MSTFLNLLQSLLLVSSWIQLCHGFILPQGLFNKSSNTGYVSFDLSRLEATGPRTNRKFSLGTLPSPGSFGPSDTSDISKAAASAVSGPLTSHVWYYNLNLDLGSNDQSVSLQVDTGSSDFWVPTTGGICSGCSFTYGTYDNSTSSTFKSLNKKFQIMYGGNDTANGTFVTDQVTFPGGATISNVTFGAVNATTRFMGIVGVSFTSLEYTEKYPNLPVALKDAGLIEKTAYSLYLSDDATQGGNILFGGIDEAKYTGTLTSYPVSGQTLAIELESIVDNNGTSYDANSTSVLLDSGTADIYLPQDMFMALGNGLGANYDSSLNKFTLSSCSLPTDEFLSFNFGSTIIKVPYSDLAVPSGSGNCILGIESSVSLYNINILGVNVLKNAYTVFNLDDKTISLAPVRHTNDTSIKVIS